MSRGRLGGYGTDNLAAGVGCGFILIWLTGILAFFGFWGFVLYLAWKLVTHITGG